MARNLNPKCKQCRRAGEKLFLKGERCFTVKCAIVKRNYPPGMHGLKNSPHYTEFGLQLKEKQKAMKSYQLMERQLHRYYNLAKKTKGDTGATLLRYLESRLDNVIYRTGLAASRGRARQFINHGHVTLNEKTITIPSAQVKIGDMIQLKSNLFKDEELAAFIKSLSSKTLPNWLQLIEPKNLQVKIVGQPTKEDVGEGINVALITEFYSR